MVEPMVTRQRCRIMGKRCQTLITTSREMTRRRFRGMEMNLSRRMWLFLTLRTRVWITWRWQNLTKFDDGDCDGVVGNGGDSGGGGGHIDGAPPLPHNQSMLTAMCVETGGAGARGG